MANKRLLKKEIACVASELFTEVLFCSLFIPGTDKDKADRLMPRGKAGREGESCHGESLLQEIESRITTRSGRYR